MRSLFPLLAFALLATPALGQEHQHEHGGPPPAVLMEGLGRVHHAVSTTNPEAQRFFDQGLAFVYAFNHDEAGASFRRAAELDPQCAMAYWGMALAVGPNINLDVDPDREKAAYEAVQKALALSAKAPETERDYVAALAKRYSNDPKADLSKLAVDYKNAMGELMRKYPDDLDAATLYAESAMDLRPWRLWTSDGKPAEGTEEIVAVLESVLRRDPLHLGANHYYIHAVEASPHPERALPSAARLAGLAPSAGHLVHMPAHIFMRTGDYERAAASNRDAAAADQAYIKARNPQGVYPAMYYSHNLHFLAAACAMEGRGAEAIRAADQLGEHIRPMVGQMPMVDWFLPAPIYTRVRFQRWDEVLAIGQPGAETPYTLAIWRYARGVAYAATRKTDAARAEQKLFAEAAAKIPADAGFTPGAAKVAGLVLDARIAGAEGDRKREITLWRSAVEAEDALGYDEPPDWYYPVRESLGGALLRDGQAAEAERVFREDLARTPRNGRSLFGLLESLKAQGKTASLDEVQRELDAAWQNADTKLSVADL